MTKQLLTSIIFFLVVNLGLHSQPKCHFEHYGTEDGLPQYTVMDILQDKKGFMWFSTWDGLSKFDGYSFSNYKMHLGDTYHMRSNRIDHIFEDKYGYIWTLSYDMEAHRFDSKTEKFMGIRSFDEHKDFNFVARTIKPFPSGKVWLLSDASGCVCITDSTFNLQIFNIEKGNLNAAKVYQIHEDKDLNTWILTDNGLYFLSPDLKSINKYFTEKDYRKQKTMQNFYSIMELDDRILFGSDKGRIWIYEKNSGQFKSFDTGSNSQITELKNIDKEQVLICTKDNGFLIHNIKSKEIKHYTTVNLKNMQSDKIVSSYIDHSKNIWFETPALGVLKFNTTNSEMKHFIPKTEKLGSSVVFPPNFFIFEDKENRLWIHPRGGGFSLYSSNEDALIPFYNEPSSPNWKFSGMLHAGFSDKQGNLWLSTRSHGLDKIIFNYDTFENTIVDKNINSTINNDIRAIYEDNSQNLWVSSKGGKVYVYDSSRKFIGHICKNGEIGNGEPIDGIAYSIMQDNEQNIWIGTKGEGVYRLSPIQGTKKYRVTNYKHDPDNIYSLSSNSIYSIYQDKNNRIWIGTYAEGINLMDKEQKGIFHHHKNDLKTYPRQYGLQVRCISGDKYGNVCVGTTFGLIMFSADFGSTKAIDFKLYTRFTHESNSLSANDIYDIHTTLSGETYLATFGGGLNFIAKTDKKGFPTQFSSYTTKNGLPSDVLLTITEDNDGDLWITSEGNLTKFDADKKTFETYSEVNRLMAGKNFSEAAHWKSKSNIIHLGYSNGYISFNPDKIEHNKFKPYVALTNFLIANKKVEIEDDSPLKTNIDNAQQIELSNKQNFISIEFAALDYIDPKRIQYAYKLDGFDNDWVIAGKRRIANYTNLSPGTYTFRVKSTNSDGVWMDNEHTLKIEIIPSFWQTKWATILYLILFISITFIILRTIFGFYRMRDRMQLEHEQTEMRSRFFTDISHEIRTPLTMILSPIENIIENEQTPNEIKSQLQVVEKNTNRLLRMVNKILDFRKIEKQGLNIQATYMGKYIEPICNNFEESAKKRGINFRFENKADDDLLWIDRDKVEQLIFNLLSNALKFTPEGRSISVLLSNSRKDNKIILQVSDEGLGMNKDILNKIFTRFASFNKDKSKPSTGIGLSIVKEVADKHHATVSVSSEIDKGSTFTVSFLLGTAHFTNDENVSYVTLDESSKEEIVENASANDIDEPLFEEAGETEQRETLLIVEDDNDLRTFICNILSPYYDVIEAENGVTAFNIANEKIPDFILSDIMMPEMDGIELLSRIRDCNQTSHIPVILLTAKSDIESKLTGLDYGADDYITKPFSVKYLRARINNIIQQRKRLSNRFAYERTSEINDIPRQIMHQDEDFLEKVKSITIQNIDNSNFLIDDLVAEIGMSRTVFFKKLKSLTGVAPVEFIRNIKIRYAAKLIETQEYSIKEASFMIGISDTKYFTQCFKKVFNMTPSEYRNLKKKD